MRKIVALVAVLIFIATTAMAQHRHHGGMRGRHHRMHSRHASHRHHAMARHHHMGRHHHGRHHR